jgi:lysozyme
MRFVYLFLGAASLVLLALTGAFFLGKWIPNAPDPLEYPIRGIDVSAHQGPIDWHSVAASGVRFAYLKATEGADFRDARFAGNLRAAGAAGIACGAYHFFSLKSPGMLQAANFIKAVPKNATSLPPGIDLEFVGNSSVRPTPADFKLQFDPFIEAIRKAYNCEPVIYTAPDFCSVYLDGYSIKRPWVRAILLHPANEPSNPWLFWQFSDRATVPGIHGFVDADVFNGSSSSFKALVSAYLSAPSN